MTAMAASGRESALSIWLRWTLLSLLVAVILLVAGRYMDWRSLSGAKPPELPLDQLEMAFSPGRVEDQVDTVSRRLAGAKADSDRHPGEWLRMDVVGSAQYQLWQLTGRQDHLVDAVRTYRDTLALDDEGTGPFESVATVALASHDLPLAERMLDRIDGYVVPAEPEAKADAMMARGDIAFQRGDITLALRRWDEAAAVAPTSGHTVRRGMVALARDEPGEARALFEQAAREEQKRSWQFMAFIWLRIGQAELARGEWDAAGKAFAEAKRLFPGWWLPEAAVAQMQAARGDVKGARRVFDALAERHGLPELMDMAALLARADGDVPAARRWLDRSGALWDRAVAALPTAFRGHAIEHELLAGPADKAVAMALADARERPHGPVLLLAAAALNAADRPREAVAMLDRAERLGWRGHAYDAARSEALALLGDGPGATRAREAALERNPRAFDPGLAFIRFAHQ